MGERKRKKNTSEGKKKRKKIVRLQPRNLNSRPSRFPSFPIQYTFLTDSSQDDKIIPDFLFEERKKIFIKLPFCGKNEKLGKTFIEKLNKFTNFNFNFIILWQTRRIKSLFNNVTKTKTFTDPKLFTKEIVALITLARL